MSPYMRAYQAGIKLAELEWMSKVADGPEEGSSGVPLEEPVYNNKAPPRRDHFDDSIASARRYFSVPADDSYSPASRDVANAMQYIADAASGAYNGVADAASGAYNWAADGLRNLRGNSAQAAPAVQQPTSTPSRSGGGPAAAPDRDLAAANEALERANATLARVPGRTTAPPRDPYNFTVEGVYPDSEIPDRDPAWDETGHPEIDISPEPTASAQQAAPRFGAPSMTRGQSNLFNTQLSGIDPSLVSFGNRPQAAQAALVQPTPATLQQANMSVLGQQAAPVQQAPVQQAPVQQAPVQQAPAQEAAADPFNFNVVRGGYGKQFRALQDAFKQRGQAEALEGFTYRDMAQAMGNRGLRVNDRFDANALLQRMRNIQDQGMGVMGGTQFAVQRQQGRGKQRGYKDIVNFQTLQQQRAATNRAIPSQSVNMPQARPGQFSNTQLESPMLAPVQSPPLSLGHNRPAIGTSGFYNPRSAAKTSPTGLNMRGDFRLNTPKQVRPFDQYED